MASGTEIAFCLGDDAHGDDISHKPKRENFMAVHLQDHVVEDGRVLETRTRDRSPTKDHVFHTIEYIGKRDDSGDRKQRIAALVIAIIICTAVYSMLYLAMHE